MTAERDTTGAPVVLITGCSSGIGLLAARRFAQSGYRVYASLRRPEQGQALRDEAVRNSWSLRTPALDVTSDESVNAAVSRLLAETDGRIDVLVNNAGYYLFGPVEETSPDELTAQLGTNVVGVLRVSRAVLPAMRARGQGRIVNMSSVSGRVVVPISGPYHASKWALEALSEALRFELRPAGIWVTLVEPGPFKTDLHTKEVRARDSLRSDSPYAALVTRYEQQSQALTRAAPDAVVDVIMRAATRRRPKLRWPVGPTSFLGTTGRRLTPDWLYEILVRLVFRL